MTTVIWLAALFCGLATAVHVFTIAVAIARCERRKTPPSPPSARPDAPPVTIVRPVCGMDNHVEETLRSSFTLDYPDYEILFCVALARDPVVPLVERLIAEHPHVPARLLIGDDRISQNPKLNNCLKGWNAAAHDWIVLADSNVLMPPDYLASLMASWRDDTGLVCAPPIGCRPDGFWAELEWAFLNTYQARWQYVADTVGLGFAQGKTMLWRRDILERAGGIRTLAEELAEDAAATKVVRGAGLRVRLVDVPFGQPLGLRRAIDVWKRQKRWAQLRRASFPLFFVPEILTSALWPIAASGGVAAAAGWSVPAGMLALAVIWYGGEYLLARAARWHVSVLSPLAWMLRDLLLPVLWLTAIVADDFEWRGNAMRVADDSRSA